MVRGLQHFNARYYDPAIGAFISPDTVYMYVSGNPLNRTDGSGHCEGPADGKVDYDSCLGINGGGGGEETNSGSSATNSVLATSTGGLFSSIGTSIRNGWNWITGSGSDSTEGAGGETQVLADPISEPEESSGGGVDNPAPAEYGPYYRIKSSTQTTEDATKIESSGLLKLTITHK